MLICTSVNTENVDCNNEIIVCDDCWDDKIDCNLV